MKSSILSCWFGGIFLIFLALPGISQEQKDQGIQVPKESYLIGEEKNLEIIVHIWGEVRNPGEKRVPDGTNILELISKAGGPTEFSNLSSVVLFSNQYLHSVAEENLNLNKIPDKFIIDDMERLNETGKLEINIPKYLNHGKSKYLPRLCPGDVVTVKRNVWYKWQTMIRVISQLAIVAEVWYWYSRIDR